MKISSARRNAWIGVGLIILLSVLFGTQLRELSFDYDFEKFFPEGDEETSFYEAHRDRFGSDNDIVLIGLRNDEGVFEKSFLEKVDSLADSLKELPYVEQVQSPTTLSFVVQDPVIGGTFQRPYLRHEEPEHYRSDSTRIYEVGDLVGTFFSRDARSLCIVLHNEDELAKAPSDTLAVRLKATLGSFEFDDAHLAGRVVAQKHYVDVMKEEFLLFLSLSFLLVLLFLTLFFRTWWGVLIPLGVVLLSVLWCLGIMGWMNEPINLLLTILPTILFVVGTSDVVHLLSKFQEELQRGEEKLHALKRAFREIGTATFLTSLTTAAGFLTLLTARIAPIRDFGIYTAIGVFIAFFMAFVLLPATLLLLRTPGVERSSLAHPIWHKLLQNSLRAIWRHPGPVLLGTGIVLGMSLWGIARMELDKKMLEDLSKDDPVQRSFRFFEKEFAGVRPFEMAIQAKGDKDVLSPSLVEQLARIEGFLREHYGVGSLISPTTLYKNSNMALSGGKVEAYRLPEDSTRSERIRKRLEGLRKEEQMQRLITEDLRRARVAGRMPDLGSKRVRSLNDSLEHFIASRTDTSLFDYRITGAAHLIDRNNALLSESMMEGLMAAFIVITLIVMLLFRSLKMIAAVLLPNVLPLLMIGGLMGWTGIPLKVSTSIIFTIAFGIAVDDTIHFTNRLKMELNKGKDLLYAIKRTYISTGRAILLTTLILCFGFISLLGSDFVGAYNIGLLVTLALFFAVLADLTLLPVLLIMLFERKELTKEPLEEES